MMKMKHSGRPLPGIDFDGGYRPASVLDSLIIPMMYHVRDMFRGDASKKLGDKGTQKKLLDQKDDRHRSKG